MPRPFVDETPPPPLNWIPSKLGSTSTPMGIHSMPSWEKSKATWTTSSSPVRSMTLTIVISSCIFTIPSRVVERYSELEGLVKKGSGGRSGESPITDAYGGDTIPRPVEARSSAITAQLILVLILNTQ